MRDEWNRNKRLFFAAASLSFYNQHLSCSKSDVGSTFSFIVSHLQSPSFLALEMMHNNNGNGIFLVCFRYELFSVLQHFYIHPKPANTFFSSSSLLLAFCSRFYLTSQFQVMLPLKFSLWNLQRQMPARLIHNSHIYSNCWNIERGKVKGLHF